MSILHIITNEMCILQNLVPLALAQVSVDALAASRVRGAIATCGQQRCKWRYVRAVIADEPLQHEAGRGAIGTRVWFKILIGFHFHWLIITAARTECHCRRENEERMWRRICTHMTRTALAS